MAGSRAIRAGAAYVELLAEDNKLVRGLERAQRMLTAFGAKVRNIGAVTAAAGAAMTAPFLAASKVFQSVGDDLAKMSARTGISVEALSELDYAAGQSGSSIAELEKAVKKMQAVIIDGERGLSTSTDALDALGLSVEQLLALNPERQFLAIASALASIEDPTRKAAVAQMVFGRVGTRLLPLLADGAEGIEALRQAARDMGLTISTESAKRAEVLGDRLDDVKMVARAAAFAVGDALAPAMIEAAKRAIVLAVGVNKWVQANKELVVTAFKVALAVTAIGTVVTALGIAIIGVGAVFGLVAGAIGVFGTALALALKLVAVLVSPVGLLVAAVVALGGAILYYSGAGGAALQWLGERFGELRKFAGETIGAIANALKGGDIKAATDVLWAALRLAWETGATWLQGIWLGVKEFFVTTAYAMWYGAVAALEFALHGIEVAWIESVAFLSKTWQRFTGGVQKAWETVQTFLAKRFIELQGLFDESLDVNAAKEQLQADLERSLGEIDAETQRKIDQAEASRQDRREKAKEEHDATLGVIGSEFDEARRAFDEAQQGKLDKAQAELEKAREAYRKAVEAANAVEPLSGGVAGSIQQILDGLASVGGVKALGTFSASAARDLGFGVEEKQLRALEGIEKSAKKIARNTEGGGLAFT